MKNLFPDLPDNLGNAYEWLGKAAADGLHTVTTPAVDTIVVYGRGGGYSEADGHVAKVTAVGPGGLTFTVTEMNYKGSGIIDTRVSTMQDVLGFVYPPGVSYPANLNPLDPNNNLGQLPNPVGNLVSIAASDIVGPVVAAMGDATGIALNLIGHGMGSLAFTGAIAADQEVKKNLLALTVAAVILVVLFT